MHYLLIQVPTNPQQQWATVLTFSGSNWDGLRQSLARQQDNNCPILKTLTLWLVCDSGRKICMDEGYSGDYGFDF